MKSSKFKKRRSKLLCIVCKKYKQKSSNTFKKDGRKKDGYNTTCNSCLKEITKRKKVLSRIRNKYKNPKRHMRQEKNLNSDWKRSNEPSTDMKELYRGLGRKEFNTRKWEKWNYRKAQGWQSSMDYARYEIIAGQFRHTANAWYERDAFVIANATRYLDLLERMINIVPDSKKHTKYVKEASELIKESNKILCSDKKAEFDIENCLVKEMDIRGRISNDY